MTVLFGQRAAVRGYSRWVKRSSDDTLRLLDTHVTELLTESAANAGWSLTVAEVDNATRVTTEEPHRESLRSYLMALRLLDALRDDLYLPNVMDHIEAYPVGDDTLGHVQRIRVEWTQAQTYMGLTLKVAGVPVTPRDAFELLAYVEHLHRSAALEAKAKAMDPIVWQMVRQQGMRYAALIAGLAVYLRHVARDDPATTHLFNPGIRKGSGAA